MNAEEWPENSDSSDEDYVPDSKVEDAVSEVESDGDPEDQLSGSEDDLKKKGRKRTKGAKKTKKRAKVSQKKKVTPSEEPVKENTSQDEKKKADDLWADFMKDTGFKPKSSKSEISDSHTKLRQNSIKTSTQTNNGENIGKSVGKVKITQIFEFAGEEVKVEKEVDPSSAEARLLSNAKSKTLKPVKAAASLSGIGSVLSQLGKKQKISTLEKSKLDWDRFKKEENIEEELETHNKGKDGYLERQDFLVRADLRRFEIEKELRSVERAKRFNSAL